MTTSAIELEVPSVIEVSVIDDILCIKLSDGRSLSVPVDWYPRLLNGSQSERNNWRLIGSGHGIYWEELDEDISVLGLLRGKTSNESQASLKKWLSNRQI